MKRISFFILSLLACIGMWGQNTKTSYYNPIMTPETASLGQFGAYPVSHYTGGVDVKIPLHTFRTRNIKVPIYLQYNGNGFIPNKDCGKVGHDWTLVAGGVITRTVNGVPDEWEMNLGAAEDYDLHGLWYSSQYTSRGLLENDSIRFLRYISIPLATESTNVETTPDMFTFNFGEHQGQFMIGHDKQVRVVGGGAYKVDISGLSKQAHLTPTSVSTIVITSGDGTKYTFGGSIDALEISLKPATNNTEYIPNGVITAFHLSKIETVDGETIEFDYTGADGTTTETFSSEYGHSASKYITRSPYYADYYFYLPQMGSYEEVTNPHAAEISVAFTRGVYLHKITSSLGGSVELDYTDKEYAFTQEVGGSIEAKWNTKNLRLDNLSVKNSQDSLIKKVQLYQSYSQSYSYSNSNQTYSPQNSYRMFLDAVIVDADTFNIEYTSRDILPMPQTRGIDLQGYYNGMDNNSTLLSTKDEDGTYKFSHRIPSFSSANKAMLKKITYPTGGTTEFTFENHDYGLVVRRDYPFNYLSSFNYSDKVGGLRIKEIKNTPGETLTYLYKRDDGNSSGVYNDLKKYNITESFGDTGWELTGLFVLSGNNLLFGNTVGESEIGYSQVTETKGTGNGKKVYTYTTFDDYKDMLVLDEDNRTVCFSISSTSNVATSTAKLGAYLAPTSNYLERGKLLSLCEYDNNDNLLKQTSYTYNTNAERKYQAIYSAGARFQLDFYSGWVANSVAHYYYPNQVSKKVVEDYSGSVCQTTTTNYTYNEANQLISEESTENSNGENYLKKLLYPQDFEATIFTGMAAANMLNPIVQEQYFVNNSLKRTVENEYARFNNKYYDLSAIKESFGTTASYYPLIIHERDAHRNIVSFTEYGKPATCYLWGYKYQYPIAKLENVSLATLNSKLTSATRQSIASSTSTAEAYGSTLSNLPTTFSSALVTLYDYTPQIGMTRCTEPTGLERHYQYDLYGRLSKEALESESNVLKQYDYNLIGAFSKLSASFTVSNVSGTSLSKRIQLFVNGGSGRNTVSIVITNASGTTIATSGSTNFQQTFPSVGNYTLRATITDNVTCEVITVSRTLTVENVAVIQFTNVEQHVRESYGNYYSTATIECEEAMTVEFSLVPMLESGTFSCTIGENYSLSGSGVENGEEKFTVELDAGTNYVEIRLIDSPNGSVDLFIQEVDGGTVGSNSILTVMAEKAEN